MQSRTALAPTLWPRSDHYERTQGQQIPATFYRGFHFGVMSHCMLIRKVALDINPSSTSQGAEQIREAIDVPGRGQRRRGEPPAADNAREPQRSNGFEDFEEFYERHARSLRRLALVLTSNAEEADDLVQESLLRGYHRWSQIRSGNPGAYVRRILVNLHRTSLRRKAVVRKHRSMAQGEVTPSHDHRVELTIAIEAVLNHLTPRRRRAILLRFYDDLNPAEIAQRLDRPVGSVKSDLHRALKCLRPLLEDVRVRRAPSL